MDTIKSFTKEDSLLDKINVCMVLCHIDCVKEAPESLTQAINSLILERKNSVFPTDEIKTKVRDMLRTGGFKPAGRQKPASEYLAQAAKEDRFPHINGPVDCNNLLSLETGLPISLLDADCFGESAILRICKAGESYVFNAGGQEMDLSGLLCVCSSDGKPLGNPVKDSMTGKIKENTKNFAGFIYAPDNLYSKEALLEVGKRFAYLLNTYCNAVIQNIV